MLSLIVLARPLDRDTDDVTLVKKKRTPTIISIIYLVRQGKIQSFRILWGPKSSLFKKGRFRFKSIFSLEKELLCVNFA